MNQKNKNLDAGNCGEIIKHYRRLIGMSQTELGNRLGTTRYTIANWEKNNNAPDFHMVRKLYAVLKIPHEVLLGESDPENKTAEMRNAFDRLNDRNRKIVRQMVEVLLGSQEEEDERDLYGRYLILPREMTPSAAGIGCPDMAMPPEPFFVRKNTFSERADALISVSGDSMEPKYFDGDLLYVRYTDDCQNGDDVVCVYHEGFILKRFYDHQLFSLNVNRPFGEKHEYDDIQIVGKVIGVVDAAQDIPDQKDRCILERLYAEELSRYE